MPKRKRGNGLQRASKRFKARRASKKRKRAMRRQGRAPRAIERPIKFNMLAPRVYTTHINKFDFEHATVAGAFKTAAIRIVPCRLRDPQYANQTQAYPENFITMASLYGSYRVNAVTMHISYGSVTNNENQKFYSMVYTTPSNHGIADPYLPSAVNTHSKRNAFLQQHGHRKRMIVSTGTTGNRYDAVHNVGFFSIAGIEEQRRADMDDLYYAGHVNVGGSTAGDPQADTSIWVSLVSPFFSGFTGTQTYDIAITMKFHVEWFDLRDSVETDRVEA